MQAEAQSKELRDGLVAWKLSFSSFVSKAQNQFSAHTRVADGVDQTHADRVWGLLGTIVSHTEPAQTQVLLQCLKYVLWTYVMSLVRGDNGITGIRSRKPCSIIRLVLCGVCCKRLNRLDEQAPLGEGGKEGSGWQAGG